MFKEIFGKVKVVSSNFPPGTVCRNGKGEIVFLVKAFANGMANFYTGENGPKSFFSDDMRKWVVVPFAEKV